MLTKKAYYSYSLFSYATQCNQALQMGCMRDDVLCHTRQSKALYNSACCLRKVHFNLRYSLKLKLMHSAILKF